MESQDAFKDEGPSIHSCFENFVGKSHLLLNVFDHGNAGCSYGYFRVGTGRKRHR